MAWASMRSHSAITALAVVLGISGCANLTTSEQRTLSGAAIGAAGGAAIAAVAEGSVVAGALIGAGAGAGAGYFYSRSRSAQHAAYHPTKYHQHAARTTKPSKPQGTERASVQVADNSEKPK